MGKRTGFLRPALAMETSITLLPFEPQLVAHFARLNKAWIQKYFALEPLDEAMLSNPQSYIIQKGGQIFFAAYNGTIAGTFALQKVDNATYELSKMAVDEAFQGLKIGNVMMQAAIDNAKAMGAQMLVLYSNTLLGPAIHLYRKFGFTEVPLAHSEYTRSNIKMQRTLL